MRGTAPDDASAATSALDPASASDPARPPSAARSIAASLLRHRELLLHLTGREISERHAGQVLGAAWTLVHPVILITVYVFLFSVVFRARIEVQGLAAPADYTIYILSGLIPWLTFQTAMAKSAVSVLGNAGLVKQVVFPIELLPAKVVLGALVSQAILLASLLVYVGIRYGELSPSFALLPVLLALQLLVLLGLAFLLGSLGCYLRDLQELVAVFGLVNTYLIPAVYLPAWVPEPLRPILHLNPFSHVIWCYQDAIFYRRIEHPWSWLVFVAFGAASFTIGCRTFRKLAPHFGNVL